MKPVWKSKTFWINLIAMGALLAQSYTGLIISAEEQIAILAVVNLIIRAFTHEELTLH